MTSLNLSKVTPKDAGNYSVIIKNKFGEAKFEFKVIVLSMYNS